MKHRSRLVVGIIVVALVIGMTVYIMHRNPNCNTNGVRSNNCSPANNRCTPPGDAREATIDCPEFKYYEAPSN